MPRRRPRSPPGRPSRGAPPSRPCSPARRFRRWSSFAGAGTNSSPGARSRKRRSTPRATDTRRRRNGEWRRWSPSARPGRRLRRKPRRARLRRRRSSFEGSIRRRTPSFAPRSRLPPPRTPRRRLRWRRPRLKRLRRWRRPSRRPSRRKRRLRGPPMNSRGKRRRSSPRLNESTPSSWRRLSTPPQRDHQKSTTEDLLTAATPMNPSTRPRGSRTIWRGNPWAAAAGRLSSSRPSVRRACPRWAASQR